MCDVTTYEKCIKIDFLIIDFLIKEAKSLLKDEIGTDAFELKVHRFRQKLRRAMKEAEKDSLRQ